MRGAASRGATGSQSREGGQSHVGGVTRRRDEYGDRRGDGNVAAAPPWTSGADLGEDLEQYSLSSVLSAVSNQREGSSDYGGLTQDAEGGGAPPLLPIRGGSGRGRVETAGPHPRGSGGSARRESSPSGRRAAAAVAMASARRASAAAGVSERGAASAGAFAADGSPQPRRLGARVGAPAARATAAKMPARTRDKPVVSGTGGAWEPEPDREDESPCISGAEGEVSMPRGGRVRGTGTGGGGAATSSGAATLAGAADQPPRERHLGDTPRLRTTSADQRGHEIVDHGAASTALEQSRTQRAMSTSGTAELQVRQLQEELDLHRAAERWRRLQHGEEIERLRSAEAALEARALCQGEELARVADTEAVAAAAAAASRSGLERVTRSARGQEAALKRVEATLADEVEAARCSERRLHEETRRQLRELRAEECRHRDDAVRAEAEAGDLKTSLAMTTRRFQGEIAASEADWLRHCVDEVHAAQRGTETVLQARHSQLINRLREELDQQDTVLASFVNPRAMSARGEEATLEGNELKRRLQRRDDHIESLYRQVSAAEDRCTELRAELVERDRLNTEVKTNSGRDQQLIEILQAELQAEARVSSEQCSSKARQIAFRQERCLSAEVDMLHIETRTLRAELRGTDAVRKAKKKFEAEEEEEEADGEESGDGGRGTWEPVQAKAKSQRIQGDILFEVDQIARACEAEEHLNAEVTSLRTQLADATRRHADRMRSERRGTEKSEASFRREINCFEEAECAADKIMQEQLSEDMQIMANMRNHSDELWAQLSCAREVFGGLHGALEGALLDMPPAMSRCVFEELPGREVVCEQVLQRACGSEPNARNEESAAYNGTAIAQGGGTPLEREFLRNGAWCAAVFGVVTTRLVDAVERQPPSEIDATAEPWSAPIHNTEVPVEEELLESMLSSSSGSNPTSIDSSFLETPPEGLVSSSATVAFEKSEGRQSSSSQRTSGVATHDSALPPAAASKSERGRHGTSLDRRHKGLQQRRLEREHHRANLELEEKIHDLQTALENSTEAPAGIPVRYEDAVRQTSAKEVGDGIFAESARESSTNTLTSRSVPSSRLQNLSQRLSQLTIRDGSQVHAGPLGDLPDLVCLVGTRLAECEAQCRELRAELRHQARRASAASDLSLVEDSTFESRREHECQALVARAEAFAEEAEARLHDSHAAEAAAARRLGGGEGNGYEVSGVDASGDGCGGRYEGEEGAPAPMSPPAAQVFGTAAETVEVVSAMRTPAPTSSAYPASPSPPRRASPRLSSPSSPTFRRPVVHAVVASAVDDANAVDDGASAVDDGGHFRWTGSAEPLAEQTRRDSPVASSSPRSPKAGRTARTRESHALRSPGARAGVSRSPRSTVRAEVSAYPQSPPASKSERVSPARQAGAQRRRISGGATSLAEAPSPSSQAPLVVEASSPRCSPERCPERRKSERGEESAAEVFSKAECLCEIGRFRDAAPLFRRVIAALRGSEDRRLGLVEAEVWAHLGVAMQSLDDVTAAVESYQNAVQLDPSLHVCFANLATLHMHLEDHDSARRCIVQALQQDPGNEAYLGIRKSVQPQPGSGF